MVTQKNLEALKLFEAARKGHIGAGAKIAESIAVGDFPVQITPLIKRTLKKTFVETKTSHDSFTTRQTVQALDVDEELNVYKFDDQSNINERNHGDRFVPGGLPRIGPREQYPKIGLSASGKKIRATNYGEALSIDWQSIIRLRGSNVNLITDAAETYGRHAKQNQDIVVAKQLVKADGFATAITAQGLALPGNPDFSDPEQIQAAFAALIERQIDGIDVDYAGYTVLTTPGNTARIKQALAARRINRVAPRTGAGSTTRGTEWEETIDYGTEIDVLGWKWLKAIWPAIGKGFLVIPKVSADDLPVITANYLLGNEEPAMFLKDSNSKRLTDGGGVAGDVNVLEDGDFDSDAIETKVRAPFGSNLLWAQGVGFSTGTNT